MPPCYRHSNMHFIEMLKPDGRILHLYGRDKVECANAAPSPRAAATTAGEPHLRWQPLRGEWIAYAPHRQARTFQPPPEYNPLRPTIDPLFPTELPPGKYDVAVFDNLFPSLSPTAHEAPDLPVPSRPGIGHCEVVVYSQDPRNSLSTLPLDHIELIIDVWGRHTELNGAREAIQYVLPLRTKARRLELRWPIRMDRSTPTHSSRRCPNECSIASWPITVPPGGLCSMNY